MRKLVLPLALLLLVSAASATAISSENVTIDLESSRFNVDLDVAELTSNDLTYVIAYPIETLDARINGKKANCYVKDLQIGSEIHCNTDQNHNFTAEFSYRASGITSQRGKVNYFQFTRTFRVPTDQYNLKVILPENSGIVDDSNVSQQIISPGFGKIKSNGQRIFVEWSMNPRLGGEPVRFSLFYEEPEKPFTPIQYIGIGLLITLISIATFSIWRRISKKDISEAYDELSEDQEELIQVIVENNGSMLQKDVVDKSEYSKAKVSGLVSELVEKGMLEKEKEGRSNKLTVSSRYRI
ncbi:MAG: helix-turn-helix transcriptional regulator [Candidatus Nanohaloarchaea archaeon]